MPARRHLLRSSAASMWSSRSGTSSGSAEMPATKRSYGQRGSTSRALGLVVETLIPFELTHRLAQPRLTAARDELLERLGHCSFFCALAADLQSALLLIGIDCSPCHRGSST